MKNTILLFFILFTFGCKSQTIIPLGFDNSDAAENGNYIKDTNGYLDKFVGTWKYISSNEEFILKIIKVEKIEFTSFFSDGLFGGYYYKKDGVVKSDNLNFTYITSVNQLPILPSAFEHNSNMQGSALSKDYQTVGLVGDDTVAKRMVKFSLKILPNTNGQQMFFTNFNRENFRIKDTDFKQGSGLGVPNGVVLIKQ